MSLVRVLRDNRSDERRFNNYQDFDEKTFFRCLQQADQDVFGMVGVTTSVEYVIHQLKSVLFEEWTEDRTVRRKCIRQGSVNFADYREVLTELIDLWFSIRPYISCTGYPDAMGKLTVLVHFSFCFFFGMVDILYFMESFLLFLAEAN